MNESAPRCHKTPHGSPKLDQRSRHNILDPSLLHIPTIRSRDALVFGTLVSSNVTTAFASFRPALVSVFVSINRYKSAHSLERVSFCARRSATQNGDTQQHLAAATNRSSVVQRLIRSLCLSLSLSLSLALSFSLFLSLSLSHTLTLPLSVSLSLHIYIHKHIERYEYIDV